MISGEHSPYISVDGILLGTHYSRDKTRQLLLERQDIAQYRLKSSWIFHMRKMPRVLNKILLPLWEQTLDLIGEISINNHRIAITPDRGHRYVGGL